MAEMHAVKAADQLVPLPDLDRVAMTEREQIAVEAPDPPVDPGAAPARARRGAALDHRLEGLVDLDLETAVPDGARQPPRHMHLVERQDAAPLWLDPVQRIVLGAFGHGKDAAGIGLEEHLRRDL